MSSLKKYSLDGIKTLITNMENPSNRIIGS